MTHPALLLPELRKHTCWRARMCCSRWKHTWLTSFQVCIRPQAFNYSREGNCSHTTHTVRHRVLLCWATHIYGDVSLAVVFYIRVHGSPPVLFGFVGPRAHKTYQKAHAPSREQRRKSDHLPDQTRAGTKYPVQWIPSLRFLFQKDLV